MLSIFSCVCWPSVCLLWRNGYLDLLHIFWLACSFGIKLYEMLVCLFVLEIKPSTVASFANIFSQSIGYLFILFMVSFVVQKLVSLIRSHLFIFACISIASDKAFLKNCFKYVEGENGKYEKIVKKNTWAENCNL